jgi:hypothetical protein
LHSFFGKQERKTDIMKLLYTLPAVVLGSALFSCKPVPSEIAAATVPDSMGVIIGNPFSYGLSDYMIFPVGCNYSPDIYENPQMAVDFINQNGVGAVTPSVTDASGCTAANVAAGTYGYEYINPYSQFYDIRNILFYDKRTGETRPLTKDTIHILSFAIHNDYKRPQIFYRIVKEDINNDSMFNELDPVMLFTSSLLGDSLVQLTPDNEQYAEYFYYQDTQTILIKTNMNPDNDTSFATVMETNFREVHLSKPAMGKEIFSQGLRDSLRVN